MFTVFVHRVGGVVLPMGTYATPLEAFQARAEFVNGKRQAGWDVWQRTKTTFLKSQGVKLEIWIERVGMGLN